ncbi:hypothetical protein DERP_006230 [Dermatophagoides pteronyssinus]|uniref:Uncharacterized protein n=1 Tax=Dermatophagoides pteronyssinus TaxID=6956 RepID=A0ABQ8IYF5_DERPT|nr:hypothetical protein DERP_006230 [Dermatophagoides pteronyssinus]
MMRKQTNKTKYFQMKTIIIMITMPIFSIMSCCTTTIGKIAMIELSNSIKIEGKNTESIYLILYENTTRTLAQFLILSRIP